MKRRTHTTEIASRPQSLRSRLCAVAIVLASTTVGVLAVGQGTALADTSPRTHQNCIHRTLAVLGGASVYTVCLTAYDWWTGTSVDGQVRQRSCNIDVPMGYVCLSNTYGQYWNSKLGAHEDWLNFSVGYIFPILGLSFTSKDCVYLRVDTKPNGDLLPDQKLIVKNLSVGTTC
jgi:hypothetical protein